MRDKNYNLYHPNRWRSDKPCSQRLSAAARQAGLATNPTQEALSAFIHVLQDEWNKAISHFAFEQRPAGTEAFSKEMARAFHATTFWTQYRNIYTIDETLFQMLRATDAGNIPVEAINWPHQYCFVAFPPGNGIALKGRPNEIDGVYIDTRYDNSISMMVIARPLDARSKPSNWPQVLDIHYYVPNTPYGDLTVAELLSKTFREELTTFENTPIRDPDELAHLEDEYGIVINDVQAENDKLRARELLANFDPAYLSCCIAINIACYLTSQPKTESHWPEHTPKDLLEKLTTGTPKQRQNASSDLMRLSIIPVNHIRFDQPESRLQSPTGRTVAAHWRRGHFRAVATGPGRTQREIRWIKPVLVNHEHGTAIPKTQVHHAKAPDRDLH